MVCSHEIAASTAQLVAASKVGTLCPVWQKHHCSPSCALGLPAGLLGTRVTWWHSEAGAGMPGPWLGSWDLVGHEHVHPLGPGR